MKALFAVFAAVFICVCVSADTTVYTPVYGVSSVSCPANADTFITIPFTRPAEFSGKVQSAAMNGEYLDVVVAGEPHWSANQFVYDSASQRNYYYLKFTSGNLEGAWYNVSINLPGIKDEALRRSYDENAREILTRSQSLLPTP